MRVGPVRRYYGDRPPRRESTRDGCAVGAIAIFLLLSGAAVVCWLQTARTMRTGHRPGTPSVYHAHNWTLAGLSNESLTRAQRFVRAHPMRDHCNSGEPGTCYGEIAPAGMASLLRAMPEQCALTDRSVFLDVGSGEGRLPLFVRLSTHVRASIGIELVGCRHRRAKLLQQKAERHGGAGMRGGLEYHHGDVRKLGLKNATHLFMHSTCWPEPLVKHVTRRAKAEGVECIIDYGRLGNAQLKEFGPAVHAVHAPATWMPEMAAIYFRRQGARGSEPAYHATSNKLIASWSSAFGTM
jgi:SAM-dependent methyltransferase